MKKYSKKNKLPILLLLVVTISIGYAALATTLKINGTSTVKGSRWNIYWDNVQVTTGSVTGTNVTTIPTTVGTSTQTVTFSVTLPEPGDFYEFTVDAVNAGSIDAMVADEGVTQKVYSDAGYTTETTLPDVLRYTVTDSEGNAIVDRRPLDKMSGNTPTRDTYKVRVEYRNDSEINPSDLDGTNDRTYYFKFEVTYVQKEKGETTTSIVCRKATSLHTENCNSASWSGCMVKGYEQNAPITYGHTASNKLTNGQLTNGQSGGYALDCDLNGNGEVDLDANGQSAERFYYVSDLYTGTENNVDQFDNDYAVLIYYKNYGSIASAYYDNSAYQNWHGPIALISKLPDRNTWINEDISLKNTTRTIRTESGALATNGGTIENPFTYTDRVARILTVQEINKACNMTVGSVTTGELDVCEYLMEDTYYSKPSDECSGGSCYYWLETPHGGSTYQAWSVRGIERTVTYNGVSGYFGVRPVIEIPKTKISLE